MKHPTTPCTICGRDVTNWVNVAWVKYGGKDYCGECYEKLRPNKNNNQATPREVGSPQPNPHQGSGLQQELGDSLPEDASDES